MLRKRKQVAVQDESNTTPIEINTEATGIELHKDSKYADKKIVFCTLIPKGISFMISKILSKLAEFQG